MPETLRRTLLGIELPIIQAPMAGVQDSALAAAVSNAGGLAQLLRAVPGPVIAAEASPMPTAWPPHWPWAPLPCN